MALPKMALPIFIFLSRITGFNYTPVYSKMARPIFFLRLY